MNASNSVKTSQEPTIVRVVSISNRIHLIGEIALVSVIISWHHFDHYGNKGKIIPNRGSIVSIRLCSQTILHFPC